MRAPFNSQRSLVWLFRESRCRFKTSTHYEGRSAGVRVRIAKGLYARRLKAPGGRPSRSYVAAGSSALLPRSVLLGGMRSFESLDKIVSFKPFSDGIGIERDAANAKLQSFVHRRRTLHVQLLTNSHCGVRDASAARVNRRGAIAAKWSKPMPAASIFGSGGHRWSAPDSPGRSTGNWRLRARKPRLLREHKGKFALVKGDSAVDTFSTFQPLTRTERAVGTERFSCASRREGAVQSALR